MIERFHHESLMGPLVSRLTRRGCKDRKEIRKKKKVPKQHQSEELSGSSLDPLG